ncbi:hypothetical protein [Pseudorhodobacter sp.]|uniref:hypothetical protein n=1 Tax=Pseudorhodobacter sp. TaxID=1934400 RepID=UPI002648882A|nr:hypothetical protein [Pseudorhodobacter sp.]MDN5788436.1 hypothetical protein [Pseudorhodobacter sp.]
MKTILMLALLAPTTAMAEAFQRPAPLQQSGAAEISFLIASICLIVALYFVHRLVMRK